MKNENIKTNDNIEKLGKVLEEKKKIPKNIREKINSKRFEDIAVGAVINSLKPFSIKCFLYWKLFNRLKSIFSIFINHYNFSFWEGIQKRYIRLLASWHRDNGMYNFYNIFNTSIFKTL